MKHLRTFVFSLVMLALVALMTCGPVSAEEPAPEVSIPVVFDSTYLAENPELMVAIRYNPELMTTGRYENTWENKSVANSAFYAANPELIFAHRYIVALEEQR
jgi:hypothetical protein